jgi:pyruvate dehydrogenase E1 component alpha subunit
MGTALERHSAVTDLSKKSAGFGVPGTRCDGMDLLDVHSCVSAALEKARGDRAPQLVEAVTYRYRGHSMADPEEYRTKEEVEKWLGRDPIATFSKRLADEGVLGEEEAKRLDEEAMKAVDEAVEFADSSPFPDLASLYDDVYVIGEQVRRPYWSTDTRSPDTHRGEEERDAGEVARELAEQGSLHEPETDEDQREARARGEGG